MARRSRKSPTVSKWAEVESPEAPIHEVASAIFRARTRVIQWYLPLATTRPDEDPEYVHQLRVATRRAAAMTELFNGCLPARRTRQLQKLWRAIRKQVGVRRDLDVLAMRVQQQKSQMPELQKLVPAINQAIRRTRKPLKQLGRQLRREHLKRQTRSVVRRIRWRGDQPEPSYAETARNVLSRTVADFRDQSDRMLASPGSTEELHMLRIAGKRVRYTMELVAGAFGPSFRTDLYPVFDQIQGQLGDINDACSTQQLTAPLRESARKGLRRVIDAYVAAEHERAARLEAEFRHAWSAERATALQAEFDAFTLQKSSV